MSGARRSRALVIGVGNTMRTDDGAGPAVIEALRDASLQPYSAGEGYDLASADAEPARLVELWDERPLAIVIDAAVSGAPPGTVHRLDLIPHRAGSAAETARRPLPLSVSSGSSMSSGSSHGAGIEEALALSRVLGRGPERLVIYGIEAADLGHGATLSPPVAMSVVTVTDLVIDEVAQLSG